MAGGSRKSNKRTVRSPSPGTTAQEGSPPKKTKASGPPPSPPTVPAEAATQAENSSLPTISSQTGKADGGVAQLLPSLAERVDPSTPNARSPSTDEAGCQPAPAASNRVLSPAVEDTSATMSDVETPPRTVDDQMPVAAVHATPPPAVTSVPTDLDVPHDPEEDDDIFGNVGSAAIYDPSVDADDLFTGAVSPMHVHPLPLLTHATHPKYPAELLKTLNQLTTYWSKPRLVYAINQVPDTIAWGNRRPRGRENEYMTIQNRPITVYLIGELVSAQFFVDGKPIRRINVQIKPVVPSDEKKALHILAHYSLPEIAPETFNGLWAIKWNGAYGVPDSDLRPFRELYDGREKFHKGYPPMNTLNASDFSIGDIVLIEAFVCRWLDVPSDEKAKFRNEAWPSWRVEYRMEAMSLLMKETAILTAPQTNQDVAG